jgi:hypothetical protein
MKQLHAMLTARFVMQLCKNELDHFATIDSTPRRCQQYDESFQVNRDAFGING